MLEYHLSVIQEYTGLHFTAYWAQRPALYSSHHTAKQFESELLLELHPPFSHLEKTEAAVCCLGSTQRLVTHEFHGWSRVSRPSGLGPILNISIPYFSNKDTAPVAATR